MFRAALVLLPALAAAASPWQRLGEVVRDMMRSSEEWERAAGLAGLAEHGLRAPPPRAMRAGVALVVGRDVDVLEAVLGAGVEAYGMTDAQDGGEKLEGAERALERVLWGVEWSGEDWRSPIPAADVLVCVDEAQRYARERAPLLVANLASLGSDAIVFASAGPGEGALRGLDGAWAGERRLEEWVALFGAAGYRWSAGRTLALRARLLSQGAAAARAWWTVTNVLVFVPDGSTVARWRSRPPSDEHGDLEARLVRATAAEWAMEVARVNVSQIAWFSSTTLRDLSPDAAAAVADRGRAFLDLLQADARAAFSVARLAGALVPQDTAGGTSGSVEDATSGASSTTNTTRSSSSPGEHGGVGGVDGGTDDGGSGSSRLGEHGSGDGATGARAGASLLDLWAEARGGNATARRLAHGAMWAALDRAAITGEVPADAHAWANVLGSREMELGEEAVLVGWVQRWTLLTKVLRLTQAGPAWSGATGTGTDPVLRSLSNVSSATPQILLLFSPYSGVDVSVAALWPTWAGLADEWLVAALDLAAGGSMANVRFARNLRSLVARVVGIRRAWISQRASELFRLTDAALQARAAPLSVQEGLARVAEVGGDLVFDAARNASRAVAATVLALLPGTSVSAAVAALAQPNVPEAYAVAVRDAIRSVARQAPAAAERATWLPHAVRSRQDAYFSVSYALPAAESLLKRAIMSHLFFASPQALSPSAAAAAAGAAGAAGRAAGVQVLVVSSQWRLGHAVFRNFAPAIRALQGAFACDLLFLESSNVRRDEVRTEGFRRVDVVPLTDPPEAVLRWAEAVEARGYDVVVWPQIGMHPWDLLLASRRLGRVQLTTYGHSSSSGSPAMDFFVGGWDVEVGAPSDVELVERWTRFGHYAWESEAEEQSLWAAAGPWLQHDGLDKVRKETVEAAIESGVGLFRAPVLAAATVHAIREVDLDEERGARGADTAGTERATAALVYAGTRQDRLDALRHAEGPVARLAALAKKRFSERLVLLDGLGAAFTDGDTVPVADVLRSIASAAGSPLLRPEDGTCNQSSVAHLLQLHQPANAPVYLVHSPPSPPPGSRLAPDPTLCPSASATAGMTLPIALAWSAPKLMADHLQTIGRALLRARAACPHAPHVLLRLFTAVTASDTLTLQTIAADAADALGLQRFVDGGVSLQVLPGLSYPQYLDALQHAAFAIDSYPFSGCNSVHDLLRVRVPTLTLRGRHWRSRIAGEMIRSLLGPATPGVVDSVQDLEDAILRWTLQPEERHRVRVALASATWDRIDGSEWAAQWPGMISHLLAVE